MSYFILVPILAGITIAVQTWLVGGISESSAPLATSMGLMLAGVLVGAVWLVRASEWAAVGVVVRQWWWLPLGAAGWAIVAVLGWSAHRLGVATALTTVVAAQLCTGVVIDALTGGDRVSISSLAGVFLVIGGALLTLMSS